LSQQLIEDLIELRLEGKCDATRVKDNDSEVVEQDTEEASSATWCLHAHETPVYGLEEQFEVHNVNNKRETQSRSQPQAAVFVALVALSRHPEADQPMSNSKRYPHPEPPICKIQPSLTCAVGHWML
jgi:hypothetical protein